MSMFLALADDECHELIPGSHNRWRTPFEHDVLLPKAVKEQGVPHTPSWNGEDPLPGQVAIRAQGWGSTYPKWGDDPYGAHGSRSRAQYVVNRLVKVVGAI